ncbi:MAG: hypothetical protein HPY85_06710 [Anaerolineae bacterium]|nr:hypothetical protein [Anaerolineae bacterium]
MIFQADSITRILSHTKVMTRRTRGLELVNLDPDEWRLTNQGEYMEIKMTRTRIYYKPMPFSAEFAKGNQSVILKAPYGGPGETIWVREAWWDHKLRPAEQPGAVYYSQDLSNSLMQDRHRWLREWYRPKSAMFMPYWAHRIDLEVIGVRAERLQSISIHDVIREGIRPGGVPIDEYLDMFGEVWDGINAKRGYPWALNPWVWAYTFKVISRKRQEESSNE